MTRNTIKDSLRSLHEALPDFTMRNGKFLFITFPRILAVMCLLVAAYYAWKLWGQLGL